MTDGEERPSHAPPSGSEAASRSLRSLREERTAQADRRLAQLFAAHAPPDACLVAVGGYGRGELAEHSDLDVVLLHPTGAREAEVARAAEGIWYPIWDAGIALDHSVRSVPAARSLAADDLKVLLGLLDIRVIAGDAALAHAVSTIVLADWRAMATQRVGELRELVRSRRQTFGEASYLLEPDLKESYGGLRDAVVLRGLAASWIIDVDHGAPEVAAGTLVDVRDAVQSVSGRRTDRLQHQDRAAVATELGLIDADDLLRRVAAAARVIAHASDVAWHRIDGLLATSKARRGRRVMRRVAADRIPLADGVVAQSGDVVLALTARPAVDPVLALRAGAAAAQAGMLIAPHALGRLAADMPPMPFPWPASARAALVSLLGAGPGALPVWESLDQAGIVSRLIPEWENVRFRPQHNPVHQFTVDRHLIGTAVEAGALSRQVRRPDLLVLSGLLHDIGKGRPGDHSEVGAALARVIVTRMGLEPADADDVVLLVRHHLVLAETATRRDLDDPATLATITSIFDTPSRIDLIEALTIADARASGPHACTAWRLSLMRDLAARCRRSLSGDEPAPPASAVSEVRITEAARAVGLGAASGPTIDVSCQRSEHGFRVTVLAEDQVGLLATVAAVLALHRLHVRQAHVATEGEIALQVWEVTPLFGDPPQDAALAEDIRRAVAGTYDAPSVLARRAASGVPRPDWLPDPMVSVVSSPGGATVLEVRAHDAPALLHAIASTIATCGVSIVGAKVDTLGSEVVDVFFLIGSDGGPLNGSVGETVRHRVLERLMSIP